MTTLYRYTNEDIKQILFDGFDYTLPSNIERIIVGLSSEIDAIISSQSPVTTNEYTERPYKKGNQYSSVNKKFKTHHSKKVENEDWENVRATNSFKATKIDKKEGIDKLMNDIRICLNKITTKNYNTQKDQIIEYIHNMVAENDENLLDDMSKVVKSIFDIASTNKYFSELYANLYKELCDKYPDFKSVIEVYITEYKDGIREIIYVDSSVDYDKYCNYNKVNDKRKALSLFIVNLMKKKLVNTVEFIDIILYLQDLVFSYIDTPNKLNEVEEITENLFILITNSKTEIASETKWERIVSNLTKCSQLKAKDKPSISSRAIFKYMDVLDNLKS
uniref:MIF4G domain-containing protein n=1 Tax=viral metagenome TaxID=1070528 RepID=A0A6C0LSS2_9ZZZZ